MPGYRPRQTAWRRNDRNNPGLPRESSVLYALGSGWAAIPPIRPNWVTSMRSGSWRCRRWAWCWTTPARGPRSRHRTGRMRVLRGELAELFGW